MSRYHSFARGQRIPVRIDRDHPYTTHVDAPEEHPLSAETEKASSVDASAAETETDWRDQALRLQAEMVNYRKRQDRRVEEANQNEKERLLNRLLPVMDNFDRLMAHKEHTDNQALWQGVELTHRELARFLEKEGVKRIDAVGRAFDPDRHEAIAAIPSTAEPGVVLQELKPGYCLGDRLLRPAQVIVAAE